MTNISAFKIHRGEKESPNEIVLVADSQSTTMESGQKYDSSQKMFQIGNSGVMHSGNREFALGVYTELRKSSVRGTKQIAQQILDIAKRHKFSPKMALTFIVAGVDEGGAKIYDVNSTGFNFRNPSQSSLDNQGAQEEDYALSGSGSEFAGRVLNGQIDVGIDIKPTDITSGFSLMKTIAEAATESVGVNDRLQYGVITSNGVKRLFHPSIYPASEEEFQMYFPQLLGISPKKSSSEHCLENIAAREANRPAVLLSGDFYNAFDQTFQMLNLLTKDCRIVGDLYLKDKANLTSVEEAKWKYTRFRTQADQAVKTLLSGEVSQIREFLREYRSRREQIYSEAFDNKQ